MLALRVLNPFRRVSMDVDEELQPRPRCADDTRLAAICLSTLTDGQSLVKDQLKAEAVGRRCSDAGGHGIRTRREAAARARDPAA